VSRVFASILILVAAATALAGCGGGTQSSGVSTKATLPSTAATFSVRPQLHSPAPIVRLGPLPPKIAASKTLTQEYLATKLRVWRFGTPASAAQVAAMSSALQRYFAAVSAHEYAKACGLMVASLQRPAAGKSCPQVLALALQHGVYAGAERTFPDLVVTGARVDLPTARGYALIGKRSTSKPEEFIAMRQEGGVWAPASFAPFPLAPPSHLHLVR
jgi:hypothetical protein